jgi:hypothetical protein
MARDTRSYSALVAAAGTASVPIRVSDGINTWTVDQISTSMSSAPVGAVSTVLFNGAQVTAMIATGDVAAGDPAITLRPADTLTVAWSGCTPGDIGTVLIFFDDGRPA